MAKRWAVRTPLPAGLTILALALVACGTPSTPQPPTAPSDVTATPGPRYVTVTWQDNSDDETGFKIYRSAVNAASLQQTGSSIGEVGTDETSFVDMDIEIDQEYDYSVVAVNDAGSSEATPAAERATVPTGVDLMVGTNNRRWTDEDNGMVFVIYFLFSTSITEDPTETFETVITGPPGWNGDAPLNYSCALGGCYRSHGFATYSRNDITAVAGQYDVTVTVAGQTYSASAQLKDASFMFPRATDITVTNASASGATVTWVSPPGTKSHYVALHVGEFESTIKAWLLGEETSFTVDDLTLDEGIYGFQIASFNSDISDYPLKVDPFGLSYDIELFGVGDVYSPECASPSEVISIPDAALLQTVRDELGIPAADITCFDLALLVSIDAQDAGITNLEGLQYALNLDNIQLQGNDVSDVSPLAGLTKLWSLNLNINEVTNVAPLANLTNLRQLHLCCSTGNITDVTPLEGLTQIEGLNLSGHQLGDEKMWPLIENYPNLRALWVGWNDLTDFSALANHPQLEVLEISGHVIDDLTPIANLENLTELFLNGAEIDDPTLLFSMTQLTDLAISGVGLADITFLEAFVNLQSVNLQWNEITSLAPLVANPGVGDGDWVDVRYNALDLDDPSVQADIRTLLDRGVKLQYE